MIFMAARHYDLIYTTTEDLLTGNVELSDAQAVEMHYLMGRSTIDICTEANLKNAEALYNAAKERYSEHLEAIR